MFALKNGHAPELSEANYHAKLSHSKRCKIFIEYDINTILLTDGKIFAVVTPKNPKKSPNVGNCSNQKKDVATKHSDSH